MCVISLCTRGALDTWPRGRSTAALGDSMSTIAISAADVALYSRYDGDLDGLSRSADRGADVSVVAWRTIDDLRQRGFIVAAGRGSEMMTVANTVRAGNQVTAAVQSTHTNIARIAQWLFGGGA